MNSWSNTNSVEQSVRSSDQLRMMVYTSLFAALISVGSYLAIPIGPVPIVLQNMFILMAGLLLGKQWGFASVALFLFAGACGLPVFSMGKGGIGHFAGITGGYLVGYLPAVLIVAVISELGKRRMVFDVIGMVLGSAVVYILGISWMIVYFGKSISTALTIGVLPFLIGDALKIAVAAVIAKQLRPIIYPEKIQPENEHP